MPGLLVTGQFHDVYASAKLKTLIKSVASSAILVEVCPARGTAILRFTDIHELRHYRLAAADNGLELRGIMAISFAARVNVPESVLVQELEMIYAALEITSPAKEEIHALIGNAPSLRYLGEMSEGSLRGIEAQWHKIYIGWHSILGQLKVKHSAEEAKAFFRWKK